MGSARWYWKTSMSHWATVWENSAASYFESDTWVISMNPCCLAHWEQLKWDWSYLKYLIVQKVYALQWTLLSIKTKQRVLIKFYKTLLAIPYTSPSAS